MTPKEDQQPMTTREELVGLADRIDNSRHLDCFDEEAGLPEITPAERDVIVNALERLASRQEVSVTADELATLLIDCWKSGKAPLQVARALLANYVITNREG